MNGHNAAQCLGSEALFCLNKFQRKRAPVAIPSRFLRAPSSDVVTLSPNLGTVTSRGSLEIGHSGIIYAVEIGQHYTAGLFFFLLKELLVKYLLVHHWLVPRAHPLTQKFYLWVKSKRKESIHPSKDKGRNVLAATPFIIKPHS